MEHRGLLGIDLGTSSVKALVVGREDGRTLGFASAGYPTTHPEPGFAEQSTDDWWRATVSAVRHALANANHPPIDAIGLSGQMHGTVLLDADYLPLGPAVTWADQRSASDAIDVERSFGSNMLDIAGSRIAPGFQAATLRWINRNHPDVCEAIRMILLPKDYLRFRLTREFLTDPSDASGTLLFDIRSRSWSVPLMLSAGVRPDQLPAIVPSGGYLDRGAALELGLPPGLPVAGGAGDAPAAALGAGVIAPNDVLVTLSSGSQVYTPLATPNIDRSGRLHTFVAALDSNATAPWYAMGATLNAGNAVQWLAEVLFGEPVDRGAERVSELASKSPPGANGLLFLPYLNGERTPHFDPAARGAFIGLDESHSRADLARALLEGIGFAAYDAFASVENLTGVAPASITLAGGGSQSTVWRQIIADQFGLPVRTVRGLEQSALGAAILAGVARGDAIEDLIGRWIRPSVTVLPSPNDHDRYRTLLPLFRRGWQANRELMHALSEMREDS